MSTSLFHRSLVRAISRPLHSRPISYSSLSRCTNQSPISPSLSLSPTLQFTKNNKSCTHPRFFSSTPIPRVRRPYPHRPYNESNKRTNFGFLDSIPENGLFWGIITINGVVFAMWYMADQRLKQERNPISYKWMHDNFTASWRNISSGRIWTVATSCFSHENIGHILFNGFTFFFMAKPVLSLLGSRQFIFLYLGGGIVANVASMAWANFVKHRDPGSYGASAAIYSVVSFLACVAPRMTFQLYGIIPVPAWLVVAGIFSYDTYSAIKDKRRSTDTAGHVAGLLSGMGYFLARRFRIL